MKLTNHVGKVDPKGNLRIPSDCLKPLGFYPGEDVEFKATEKGLLIEPRKEAEVYKGKPSEDPVEALTGSIPLNDPKLIDEIIESEEVYG